ncbi:MAG: glycosyltransferase [ANME-2 cluster archaeon]|nr:glycosyltransferase [ANME-2 cluster archaeon]
MKEALDSILAQTFTNFELIISDNASTDGTYEICKEYADKDPRIQYYRNEQNLGAAWNFNRVFELSRGKYFKWAAHDDILDPNCISEFVEVLDNDDSIILCNSKAKIIDKYGEIIRDYIISSEKPNSHKPQDRFGYLILLHHACFDVFGLIRSDALRKSSLIQAYSGSDRALLAELSLLGRFYEIPEYLFFNRDHAERSIKALPNTFFRSGWFDPSKEGKIIPPRMRIFSEYVKFINRSSLGWYERACCYGHMCNWLRRYYRLIAKELLFIVQYNYKYYQNRIR